MRHRAASLVIAIALVACGYISSTDIAATDVDRAVTELTSTLDAALVAAKAYGRQHLGHYLELRASDLVVQGFRVPADISLVVQADHLGVCLAAEHIQLPGDHPWRVASIDLRTQQPTAGNTCAPGSSPAQAATGSQVATAGGGLICVLPPE